VASPQGTWYDLALGVLAAWRVTHLLHAEHGPWGLLARVRAAATRLGLGEAFSCFYCLSVWTAIPIAVLLVPTWRERALAWLALSAGSILLEVRVLGGPAMPDTEEEPTDDLLR
jgi:hypothetical protein